MMKLKRIFSAFLAPVILLTACSDDISTVGSEMQPEGDGIDVNVDHVYFTPTTVPLPEVATKGLYIRSVNALLGNIGTTDDLFGETKADFMAEFFVANATFETSEKGYDDITIDSVKMIVEYINGALTGNTDAPMGISIYEINKKNLQPNFYTSIKPSDYTDQTILWGERFFVQSDLRTATDSQNKIIDIDIDKSVGQRIYDQWVADKKANKEVTILNSTQTFKDFIKGIYVTSQFNNKTILRLIDVNSSIKMNTYYKYHIRNVADTADSLIYRALSLRLGADGLLLNSLQSSMYGDLPQINSNTDTNKNFVKSLSDVVTKYKIPLKEIREKGEERTNSDKFNLNSAIFTVVGLTEEETDLPLTDRVNAMLFINKDSISEFFSEGRMVNDVTSFLLRRESSNNTYYVRSKDNFENSIRSNISSLINHYLIDHPTLDEVEYLLIPVDVALESTQNSSYVTVKKVTRIANAFNPSAAILRTTPLQNKVSLVFSKFNSENQKNN